MSDFLVDAVRAHPDALAAEDGVRRWTYRDLDDRSRRISGVLREAGAEPGARLALVLEPGLDGLATLHGAFRTGAVVAPIDPRLTAPERTDALGGLEPTLVVGEAPAGPMPTLSLAAVIARARAAMPVERFPSRDPTTAAAVLWTSGTSGRPRGVLISEAALRASAEASRRRLGLALGDVWYASLSTAHVGGMALVTRAAILGVGLAVRGRFRVDELDALLETGAVTHTSLVPTMLLRLLDRRRGRGAPPGLRCVLVGGAHAPADLVDRALAEGYPLALTYGLTEATSQVATAPPDEVRRDPGSVGRPLDGVEVRVAPDGEVQVRGATIAVGLLGGGRLTDADGWLSTGDLGSLDSEGRLTVTGRRSDRIVSGGATVDALEVEGVLREHPDVADACVVGVPDPVWGERVAAWIVWTAPEGDPDALLAWAADRLAPAKRPRSVHVLARLPLRANGKVDRADLRARLR